MHLKFKHKTINTQRLKLRRPLLFDAEDLFVCTSNPNVVKYEGWRRHASPFETLNFVNNLMLCYDEGFCYDFIIEEKDSGRAVGVINLHDIDFTKDIGYIGYWLAEDVWGKGYGTEAARAFVEFFFKKAGINVIYALCHPKNTASYKLLEKIGFLPDGEKEDSYFAEREDDTKTAVLLRYKLTSAEFFSKAGQ